MDTDRAAPEQVEKAPATFTIARQRRPPPHRREAPGFRPRMTARVSDRRDITNGALVGAIAHSGVGEEVRDEDILVAFTLGTAGFTGLAPKSGELAFAVNDRSIEDNDGGFDVSVSGGEIIRGP